MGTRKLEHFRTQMPHHWTSCPTLLWICPQLPFNISSSRTHTYLHVPFPRRAGSMYVLEADLWWLPPRRFARIASFSTCWRANGVGAYQWHQISFSTVPNRDILYHGHTTIHVISRITHGGRLLTAHAHRTQSKKVLGCLLEQRQR